MSVTRPLTFRRNLLGFVLAVGLLATWALVSLVSATWAHDFSPSFKWNDDDATPQITNYNTQYQQAILSAYDDYDANSYLDVEWCAYPCGANIIHYEANLGATNATAKAHVFSDSSSCFPLGYCNETDRRANFAYVYWNSYYGLYNSDAANYLPDTRWGTLLDSRTYPALITPA